MSMSALAIYLISEGDLSRSVWWRLECSHHGCVGVIIDSPWLPGFPSSVDVRAWSNSGTWTRYHECLGFGMPFGQLLKRVRLQL